MEVICKYSDWTRGEISQLLNIIGQNNGQKLLMPEWVFEAAALKKEEARATETIYLDYWSHGRIEALLNVIGEENAKKLLANEISFTIKQTTEASLFDKNGRRIPKNLEFNVCDSSLPVKLGNLFLESEKDYQELIDEFNRPLGGRLKITGEELKTGTEKLLALIGNDKRFAKILNGAWVPIILPKLTGIIEKVLNEYLRATKFLYTRHCGTSFAYKDNFCGNVHISPASRYDKAISKMIMRDLVGIYFINPLQGYSVLASREQMKELPEEFVLSGFEPLIAGAMYPKIFFDQKLFLDLAAFSWVLDPKKGNFSQSVFRTKDSGISYGANLSLNRGDGDRSSGLLFIG